jgi:hypothetical protein
VNTVDFDSVEVSPGTPANLTDVPVGVPQFIYAVDGIVLRLAKTIFLRILSSSSDTSHPIIGANTDGGTE